MRLRLLSALVGSLVSITPIYAQQPPTTAPTTSPSGNGLSYTLGDSNHASLAENPTIDQIKAAVVSIDGDKVDAIFLNRDEAHGIQVNWDGENHELSFQYWDGGEQHMYQTSKKYPPEMAVKLLSSYMSGKDDWLSMVKWEPVK